MSKGTVVYVGGFELPDKNAAAHRVISIGKILRELGYEVLFVGVDKKLSKDVSFLSTEKEVQGFKTWSIPYPKGKSDWIGYLSNVDYLNELKKIYNINSIISYNYPSIALKKLINIGIKNEIKIYADCTEWYSPREDNILFNFIKKADTYYRMHILQKKLDGLIVISTYLEEYYSGCKNVVRIPPLVDVEEEKWIIEPTSDNKNNMKDKIKLVYAGSPGKNKDILGKVFEALVEVEEYKDYQINIVGLTETQFLKDNPQYIKTLLLLKEKINFLGRISHNESINEIKKADYSIFVRENSRLTEAGFPTKYVESITCSTPVITTKTSDIKEYFLNESYGYLLEDSNIETLTNILREEVLSNKKTKKEPNINNGLFDYNNFIEVLRDFI